MCNLIELFRNNYRLDAMRLTFLDSVPLLVAQLEGSELADLAGKCTSALTAARRKEEATSMIEELIKGCSASKGKNAAKEARLLLILARVLRASGRDERALPTADRGLQMKLVAADPPLRAKFMLEKAMALEGLGRLEEARSLLSVAEETLRQSRILPGQLAVAMRRGIVEEKMGDRQRAADLYRQAFLQAERLGDPLAIARSSESLGRVLDPRSEERSLALQRALDIYSDLGMVAEVESLRALVEGC